MVLGYCFVCSIPLFFFITQFWNFRLRVSALVILSISSVLQSACAQPPLITRHELCCAILVTEYCTYAHSWYGSVDQGSRSSVMPRTNESITPRVALLRVAHCPVGLSFTVGTSTVRAVFRTMNHISALRMTASPGQAS